MEPASSDPPQPDDGAAAATGRKSSRRLTRKTNADRFKHQPLYDSAGVCISTNKDTCDCLVEGCEGCHFPCPKCRSPKCGHECRINRRWSYESIVSETLLPEERGSVFEIPESKPVEIVIDDDDKETTTQVSESEQKVNRSRQNKV